MVKAPGSRAGRATDANARLIAHARRAAGQAGAVAEMVRAQAPFPSVVQQVLATRGSLDALLVRLAEAEIGRELQLPDEQRVPVERVMRSAFDRKRGT